MVNMSAKFDNETCNGVVSILFTRSTHGQTDGTTAALLYPHRNALRGDKNHGTALKVLLQGMHMWNTVNMVIFAGGKFRENVGKTFHVGVIFTILLLFPS